MSRTFRCPRECQEALLDDFQQTMDKFKVPAAEQVQRKLIVNSTSADVFIDSALGAASKSQTLSQLLLTVNAPNLLNGRGRPAKARRHD